MVSRMEEIQVIPGCCDMYTYRNVYLAHATRATYIAKLANLHSSEERAVHRIPIWIKCHYLGRCNWCGKRHRYGFRRSAPSLG